MGCERQPGHLQPCLRDVGVRVVILALGVVGNKASGLVATGFPGCLTGLALDPGWGYRFFFCCLGFQGHGESQLRTVWVDLASGLVEKLQPWNAIESKTVPVAPKETRTLNLPEP